MQALCYRSLWQLKRLVLLVLALLGAVALLFPVGLIRRPAPDFVSKGSNRQDDPVNPAHRRSTWPFEIDKQHNPQAASIVMDLVRIQIITTNAKWRRSTSL